MYSSFLDSETTKNDATSTNGKMKGILLPMEGSSDNWMDDDVGFSMEDEDNDSKDKKSVKTEEANTGAVEATKPSGISLPMNGSSDDWMDDDVGFTMEDEEEEKDEKEDTKAEESVQTEKANTVPVETSKASGISLPMNGSSDDWMDDDVGFTMEDEEEEKDEKEDTKAEESVQTERANNTVPVETPKASGISLPMSGSSDDWMDDDVGFTMEDEDNDEVQTTNEPANIKNIQAEASEDIPEKKEKTSKNKNKKEKGKVDQDPEDGEKKSGKKNEQDKKQKNKSLNKNQPEKRTDPRKEREEETVKDKTKKELKSPDDVDSVLDDWLNGGDDEIPDELPDIEIKKEKKDVKSLKTQKANELLHNMNKLSGIMDDTSNTKIQSSVENFFGGRNGGKKCETKKEKPVKIVEIGNIEKDRKTKKEKTPINIAKVVRNQPNAGKEEEITKSKNEPLGNQDGSAEDIDSLLDDWLNGGVEEIPDELPDIEAKKEKTDFTSVKAQKAKEMFSNMNNISGVLESGVDTKLQHTVKGSEGSAKKTEKSMMSGVSEEQEKVEAKKIVAESEVPVGDCAVCSNIAKAICTGCKNVFYCTRQCQKKHWTSHKDDCKSLVKLPYRVI